MNFLILGGGGREHALAVALEKSKNVTSLHCAPGNPGINRIATPHATDPNSPAAVVDLCRRLAIDCVVVGPEAPLVAGVADALRDAGFSVFGPSREGARLEGSKVYSKRFMKKHGIPTSDFDVCATLEECRAALAKRKAPYVVKADGLAAGKGVFLTNDASEAEAICRDLLEKRTLGDAGATLLIEDHVRGDELTILALVDGNSFRLLPSSQDHKRAFDGDAGPNTGGMGAYSPVPWVAGDLLGRIECEVFAPVIKGLKADGIDYRGILYAGLMLDGQNLSVLEFNVRMGDPEAQEVLTLLANAPCAADTECDFARMVVTCADGHLERIVVPQTTGYAVGVVMASGGYPGSFEKGFPIEGLDDEIPDTFVYHAGTAAREDGRIVTAGGRVLTVVGMADDFEGARKKAYARAATLSFKGAHYRKDIGKGAYK